MWTILKLLGGIQPNYWGNISPHPPLVSAPLRVVDYSDRYMVAGAKHACC